MVDDAYTGEIRMFAFGQVPTGWLPCNGQTLTFTQEYLALYSVIKSTYGGNDTSFNLPNLQCCAPLGACPWLPASATPYGSATVSLLADQLPAHSHSLNLVVPAAGAPGTQTAQPSATAMLLGGGSPVLPFSAAGPQQDPFAAETAAAGNTPAAGHDNVHPSLAVQFCICYAGFYPAS